MKIKVGYMGPAGTFSEQAALKGFKDEGELVSLRSTSEIFDKLQSGEIKRGVIPIENSLEGSVNLSMDLLFQNSFARVVGEIVIPVRHFLMVNHGTKITEIEQLYSHSQAIGQSNKYIDQYLTNVQVNYTGSTAQAAEVIKGHKKWGMIGSIRIKDIYNLEIIAEDIQDYNNNYTRFFTIANQLDVKEGFPDMDKEYKTSIICAPEINEAGVLYDILGEFKKRNVNLTRIESRPTKRQLGEYLFYIDFIGHYKNRNVRTSLEGIEKRSSFFKVLGSYEKGNF